MKDMMIGVDLAKSVFQVHGALQTGEVLVRKKLTRKQFFAFMANQEPCLVVFEACCGAHFWVREMKALGHEAKLIAPQYVRPFVKRQKNDAADAEAIVIAARQPEMRFVAAKTVEQQSRAAVFRGRERLVHQRTEDVNALRALLYEHGHVFPLGIRSLDRMAALLEDETTGLPILIRTGLSHLYFESIHPFEDGNGRLGRALAEKSLAQNIGQPILIALAFTIERERKAYYDQLERHQKTLDVTPWLVWFAETVLTAQQVTLERVRFFISKTHFYDRHRDQFQRPPKQGVYPFVQGWSGWIQRRIECRELYLDHGNIPRHCDAGSPGSG